MFLKTSNLQRFKHHNAIDTKSKLLNNKTINHLCQGLGCIDWKDVYSQCDAQDVYKHFYTKLYRLFDKNIPLIKPRSKNPGTKVPWITKGILKSRRTKNVLYKKFMKNPTKRNKTIYKRYRNKFNKLTSVAKKQYYDREFSEHKSNLRYLWKLINEVINRNKLKPELPDHFKENETLITDPTEISNKFNEYFINVGPNLATKIPVSDINFSNYLGERCLKSIFLDPVTENEVEFEICKLKENKSCGHDEIPPKLVKNISKYIIKPLTYTYTQSFPAGSIPDDLKVALVTPAFKANDREEFSNYRPISVLPCFSKILEKLMYNR